MHNRQTSSWRATATDGARGALRFPGGARREPPQIWLHLHLHHRRGSGGQGLYVIQPPGVTRTRLGGTSPWRGELSMTRSGGSLEGLNFLPFCVLPLFAESGRTNKLNLCRAFLVSKLGELEQNSLTQQPTPIILISLFQYT